MDLMSKIFSSLLPLRILHEESGEGIGLSLATLVLSLLLVCYIISGPMLKKLKIKFIRPSGLIMIVGILITLLTKIMNPSSSFFKGFQFNHSLFFTFILPIVIFSSSYNSKIEDILKYFRYILLFSICGSLLSFIFISIITYFLNTKQFFTTSISSPDGTSMITEPINLSLLEILQFSAAISACDSVISLSFLMEDNEPKLNAISLGDSILNNAVAISLFNSVSDVSQKEKELTFQLSFKILIKCILIFLLSLIIGIVVGIFHAIFLRYMKKYRLNRVQEVSTILLFGFSSYILCDCIDLSGMTALLACGLCMSHYTFYNLCYQTREESSLVSLSLNCLAEALIFSALGMTIVYYTLHSFSIKFIITELILIVLCRIFTIFGQINILELCGVKPEAFKLKPVHKSILTNLGSIRGVVSFGLALLMITPNEGNKNLLVGSTIYIVFLTNILCILISPLFKRREREIYDRNLIDIDTSDDKVMKHDIFTFLHPNTEVHKTKPKKIKTQEKIKQEESSYIFKFIQYDNKVILPKLVGGWPEIKRDNNEISIKIKKAVGNWAQKRQKDPNYKETDTIGFNIPIDRNALEMGGNKRNYNNPSPIMEENEKYIEKDNDMTENKNGETRNDRKKIELQDIITNK